MDKRRAFMKLVRNKNSDFLQSLLAFTDKTLADFLGVPKDELNLDRYDAVLAGGVSALTDLASSLDRGVKEGPGPRHSDIPFPPSFFINLSKSSGGKNLGRGRTLEAVKRSYLLFLTWFDDQKLVEEEDYPAVHGPTEKLVKKLLSQDDASYRIELVRVLAKQERYRDLLERLGGDGGSWQGFWRIYFADSKDFENPEFRQRLAAMAKELPEAQRGLAVTLPRFLAVSGAPTAGALGDLENYFAFLQKASGPKESGFCQWMLGPVEAWLEGAERIEGRRAGKGGVVVAKGAKLLKKSNPLRFWDLAKRPNVGEVSKTLGDRLKSATVITAEWLEVVDYLCDSSIYKAIGEDVCGEMWGRILIASAEDATTNGEDSTTNGGGGPVEGRFAERVLACRKKLADAVGKNGGREKLIFASDGILARFVKIVWTYCDAGRFGGESGQTCAQDWAQSGKDIVYEIAFRQFSSCSSEENCHHHPTLGLVSEEKKHKQSNCHSSTCTTVLYSCKVLVCVLQCMCLFFSL